MLVETDCFDAGQMIRATRRTRRISQRELAALAGVPNSTVARIEAGRTVPRLDTVARLIHAAGYDLVLSDRQGRLLTVAEGRDRLVDRAGRRFPLHLESARTPDAVEGGWWGWYRIAWSERDPIVPKHTYWRRYQQLQIG